MYYLLQILEYIQILQYPDERCVTLNASGFLLYHFSINGNTNYIIIRIALKNVKY